MLWLVVLVLSVVWWYRRDERRNRLLAQFPGDYALPVLGNALQVGLDSEETCARLMDMWERHGKQNFRVTFGSENWVFLSNPDDVQRMHERGRNTMARSRGMQKRGRTTGKNSTIPTSSLGGMRQPGQTNCFLGESRLARVLLSSQTELAKPHERNAAMMPFFGYSVSTAEGDRWRAVRKMIVSCFHFKKLNAVNEHCDRLMEILNKKDNHFLDMYKLMKPHIMDIMCDTILGVKTNFVENLDHPYFETGKDVVEILTNNYFNYWRTIQPVYQLTEMYRKMVASISNIRNFSNTLIAEKKSVLLTTKEDKIKDESDHKKSESYLIEQLLRSRLADGSPLPHQVVDEEVGAISFTSHYATTLTMCHAMYFMAKYPDVQEKILEEQKAIFADDELRIPTNEDLNKMKYLEAVIRESLRILPTVSKIGRQLHEDLKLSDGRIIPAGCTVIILYKTLQMNPALFPEPHKFVPERFFASQRAYSIVSFSAGPRGCAGAPLAWMSMKTTLSRLLRRFAVRAGGPAEEPQIADRVLTESKNGVQLRLKLRNNIN